MRDRCLGWGVILALPAVALGQAPAQIPPVVCVACHGAGGNSAIAANPKLAGQDAGYTARQLRAFKSDVRVSAVMKAMVATLSEEDMVALGTYYAKQVSDTGPATATPPSAQAKAIYANGDVTTGLPACSACHAPDGKGTTTYYPRLAGQHADYLYEQLKAFKSGARGANKDGRDAQGRIMWEVAQRLPEAQMRPLAEYLSALR